MTPEIRTLTIDNYEEIVCLWADAGLPFKPKGRDSREMMAIEMALPQTLFIGLYDHDTMIGVGIGNYDGRRGWVNRVAIDPDQRGKKLARLIIKKLEEFLYEQGAVIVCALIEDENYPSIACFQNSGYIFEKTIGYFAKRNSADS